MLPKQAHFTRRPLTLPLRGSLPLPVGARGWKRRFYRLRTVTEDLSDDLDIDDVVEPEPSPARRIEITLDETAAGQRLDRALAVAVPELSRVRIQALLA